MCRRAVKQKSNQNQPPSASGKKSFEHFFENLPFMLPWQSIKVIDLDKIHINRRGLLKKKNRNICSETAKNADFHFSHYKSMVNVSYSFPQSTDAICGI